MKKAYAKQVLSLLLFGSNGIVASRIAMNSYEIVLFRCLIGSLFLIAVFVASRQKFRVFENRRALVCLLISGAAMGASWMFLYEAYVRVGVSVATLAYYCGPVIVVALAPLIFREKLTAARLGGLAAVMAGMVLVNGGSLLREGFSWGLVCGILSAVAYAVMIIFNKRAEGVTGLENTLCQLVVSFFVVGLFVLIRQGGAIRVPAGSFAPLLLLGVVNTGLGCYLYFSSVPHLPAASVALCGYLEPVSALVFSALFLTERLTAPQLAGTALILGGAALGERFGRRRAEVPCGTAADPTNS